jgi:DNA-binding LacI/PurR family transcriptional regulator
MQQVIKMRAVELTVAALRAACQSGQWSGRLPGVRILGRQLGVSVPTVAAALSRLAAEGVLTGSGERRAYRVKAKGRGTAPRPQPRSRLVILTTGGVTEVGLFTSRLLERVREAAIARGWETEAQVLDYHRARRPRRIWDRQVRLDGNTSVVAALGNPALAEWVTKRGARALFLGGVNPGHPVTMIAVRSTEMARTALARLTALGHHRILVPLCGHSAAFNDAMRQETRAALEAAGRVYQPAWHNPETDYLEPEVVWRMLERQFAGSPSPTALVASDWQILVTACCYFCRVGLRVPEDVSVVLLSDHEEAAWFLPVLARFRFPKGRMVKAIRHWLEDPAAPAQTTYFPPDFLPGATLAPPAGSAAEAAPGGRE